MQSIEFYGIQEQYEEETVYKSDLLLLNPPLETSQPIEEEVFSFKKNTQLQAVKLCTTDDESLSGIQLQLGQPNPDENGDDFIDQ